MSTEPNQSATEKPPVNAADLGSASDDHETPTVDPEEVKKATEEGGGETPSVYDSEARQRIPVTLWQDAGRLDVTLICEPVSETTLLHYTRMVTAATAEDAAEEAGDAATRFGGLNRAGCWFFDVLMSGVEGVGEEGEELPDDWRDRLFGPLEKAEVINRAILGVEFVPPPSAPQSARPSWAAQARAVVNRFRVPFNARMVDVSHTLSRPDAARLGEFMARQVEMHDTGNPGVNMENFARGYDALHLSHAGYRGDPPLHHKAFAYAAHLNRVTAALRKN